MRSLARMWCIPDHPPPNPDCFVIPSYALVSRTLPTRPTCAPSELATEWWRRFPAALLVMSTGDNQGLGIANSAVMADYAHRLGVPRSHIIEENRSLTTVQNLRRSWEIVRQTGCQQPTLVTLDLYTRRAVATARKNGWRGFYWLSAFAQGQPAYGYKWLQTHSRKTILGYEVAALLLSRALGWA